MFISSANLETLLGCPKGCALSQPLEEEMVDGKAEVWQENIQPMTDIPFPEKDAEGGLGRTSAPPPSPTQQIPPFRHPSLLGASQ
jgi:hypothetical protein